MFRSISQSLCSRSRSGFARCVILGSTLTLVGCGGGGSASGSASGGGAIPTTIGGPALSTATIAADIQGAATWLDTQQLQDGAILYTTTKIEPYYANNAATGLTKIPAQLPRARQWMAWFVNHINATDVWGLGGTVYDYSYSGGTETPLNSADSVDSYNATFLTLARVLYDTGDPTSQQYVVSLKPTLERLAATIVAIQQSDGLTISQPGVKFAYLMDNAEVYRGFSDLSYLETNAFGDGASASTYTQDAQRVAAGISSLWNASISTYAYAKTEPNGVLNQTSWSIWYPDATAQLYPALEGVIAPSSARALSLWNAFNSAYPQWSTLSNPSGYPWARVADAAVLMNDTSGVTAYIANAQSQYAVENFPWTWYDAEGGWYIRAMNQLQIGAGALLADN
jgi:hypothetical protein